MRLQDYLGPSVFFVNNFWSDWNRKSRKAWACDDDELLNRLKRSFTSLFFKPWSEGPWPDLVVSLDFDRYQAKYIILRSLARGLRCCLKFGSASTFGGVMSQKPKHDFWPLTWSPVNLKPKIWVPTTASRNGRHSCFFFYARLYSSAHLGVKRWKEGGSPPSAYAENR